MSKPLTIAHVKFPVKVDMTEHAELGMKAQAAGVQWHEALEILECKLHDPCTCKAVARAIVVDMLNWSPEEWAAAKQEFV